MTRNANFELTQRQPLLLGGYPGVSNLLWVCAEVHRTDYDPVEPRAHRKKAVITVGHRAHAVPSQTMCVGFLVFVTLRQLQHTKITPFFITLATPRTALSGAANDKSLAESNWLRGADVINVWLASLPFGRY